MKFQSNRQYDLPPTSRPARDQTLALLQRQVLGQLQWEVVVSDDDEDDVDDDDDNDGVNDDGGDDDDVVDDDDDGDGQVLCQLQGKVVVSDHQH